MLVNSSNYNESILQIAEKNQKRAWEIVNSLKIVEIWKDFGATANLVGSLRTGLLMKNKDVDFHIYSDNFSIVDSFGAIAQIANNNRICKVDYINLLETEEQCLEWHAWYRDDDDELWHIDMIHILNESIYAGRFEMVADKIKSVLTPELKYTILSIKNSIDDDEKIMGIDIYQAVIESGVKNYDEFKIWNHKHKQDGINMWMPGKSDLYY